MKHRSWGTGQTSPIELEQSCLASGLQGSRAGDWRLWLVLPGSSLAFSNRQMPGGRMVNASHDFPFPHFVWVLFWLTLWQWSMNCKGWILKSLVLCIGIYVRETRVLRRYKKLSNQGGSLLYHSAEMQKICKAVGNQTSITHYRYKGHKIGYTEQMLLAEPLQWSPAIFPFSLCFLLSRNLTSMDYIRQKNDLWHKWIFAEQQLRFVCETPSY